MSVLWNVLFGSAGVRRGRGSTTGIILTYSDVKIGFVSSLQMFRLHVCTSTLFTVCLHGIFLLYLGHTVALPGSIQDFHTIPLQSVTQN